MRPASARASASWAVYFSSAACASACAASAELMLPSIASLRASSILFRAGRIFQMKSARMMRNASVPQTRSGSVGSSGLISPSWPSANALSIRTPSVSNGWLRRGERDEGDRDRDERERLGQCDTQKHEAAEATLQFGLTRHRFDGLADDDADADTGADSGESEGEGCELSDDVHRDFLSKGLMGLAAGDGSVSVG